MVTLEGATATTISRDKCGQRETQRPKPALPGTRAEPETQRKRRLERREGNHQDSAFLHAGSIGCKTF